MAIRLDEKEKNAYLYQLDTDWQLEGSRLITPDALEKLINGQVVEGQSDKVSEDAINQTIDSQNTLPNHEQSYSKVDTCEMNDLDSLFEPVKKREE